MRTFVATAIAVVATATLMDKADYEFMKFVAEHNKHYATVEEYNFRAAIFKNLDKEIQKLNSQGGSSVHGHNYMSDWTHE